MTEYMLVMRIDPADGPIPGGAFELARKISEALIADGDREGYDLEGGLYGRELSQLLVEIDKWHKKSELFDMIRALMGYVQNGTSQTVKMFQDDATMSFSVVIEGCGKRFDESAPSLEAAILRMHHKYGGE